MPKKKETEKPTKEDSQHLKDSCDYAISITKTLLSYSSAGIAFVISIILSGKNFYPSWATWVIIIALALSILLGLFFLMNIVGHINQFENYNVNIPRLRKITLWQMSTFFIPILLLGGFAIWHGTNNENKTPVNSSLNIQTEKYNLEKELDNTDTLKIIINGDKIEFKN